jgi:hypothetical protein
MEKAQKFSSVSTSTDFMTLTMAPAAQHGPGSANPRSLKQGFLNKHLKRIDHSTLKTAAVTIASMASATRRAFTSSWGARCIFAQYRPVVLQCAHQRPWGHNRIPSPNAFRTRSYHSGYSGSGGHSWYVTCIDIHSLPRLSANRIRDGLVYSIMSNIRGEYNFGPECFLGATSSDLEEETGRRDMRELVPLRLNRPWLLATAQDIQLRLEVLCKEQIHTFEYTAMLTMMRMLEKLGSMQEDNPKLELSEYREIFIALRDGLRAGDELPTRVISVRERPSIQNVQFSAECVWGVAVVNAALRRLEGTRVGVEEVDAEDGSGMTFEGDLMTLSGKINGLLLDSKDNFPEGEKWFGREDEERILEAVVRVMKEAGKRRGW